MTRFIYSCLLTLISPLLLVYLTIRSKKNPDYRHRWGERFGLTQLQPTQILVHAVSMGETLAAVPLIRNLLSDHPKIRITLTSSSPTGSAEVTKAFAKELASGQIQHAYLPFDISFCIKHFLRQVQPSVCLIMETELWPNFIHFAHKQGCKLALINGRLSKKSSIKYHKWSGISRPMLSKINIFAVQTQIEAQRFINLGVNPQDINVCGSLKFDLQIKPELIAQAQALRKKWHKSHVWIAGSVHPAEFAAIIQAHQSLLKTQPDTLLVMVPRHPEQFDLAAEQLSQAKLNFAKRSQNQTINLDTQVLLGDTMGELLLLYGASDIAFIGGTLIERGGHNPLEAAAFGLPILSGDHYWNFAEITEKLMLANNLILISNANTLAVKLGQLFADPKTREIAGAAGLKTVKDNQGALHKQYQLVSALINNSLITSN